MVPTVTPPAPSVPSKLSNDDANFREGLLHHKEMRLDEAALSYRLVLAKDPDNATALCLLGIIAHSQGQPDEALKLLSRSLVANPDYANTHLHLGDIYSDLNRPQEALACYTSAIELKPDYLDAYNHKSALLQNSGRFGEALDCAKIALTLAPGSAKNRLQIAVLLRHLNRPKEALFQLDVTLTDHPDFVEALVEKGTLLMIMDEVSKALAVFNLGLSLDDNITQLHAEKGVALARLMHHDEALESYNRALQLDPDYGFTHSNLAVLLRHLGDYEGAVKHLHRAIEIDPDSAVAHHNLGLLLLCMNEFEHGMQETEWRWRVPFRTTQMRTYEKPQWDGTTELADKTILLWSEQGPQDVMIWATGLPQIIDRSKHCIVNIYPKLVPLFKRSFPDAEIRPDSTDYDKSQNDFDFHLPLGSLFKYTRPDIAPPHQDAYLVPDPNRVTYWRQRLSDVGPGPYVGISWKGAIITDLRSPNYTEVEDWAGLIHKPATFVNLQCGESATEITQFEIQHGVPVHRFDDLDLFDGLDEVAAFAAALDAAISVSTCVSAITAGVGTKTWILAWKQSPWNNILMKSRGPDVSHFERSTGEDWTASFDAIGDRLQSLIDG